MFEQCGEVCKAFVHRCQHRLLRAFAIMLALPNTTTIRSIPAETSVTVVAISSYPRTHTRAGTSPISSEPLPRFWISCVKLRASVLELTAVDPKSGWAWWPGMAANHGLPPVWPAAPVLSGFAPSGWLPVNFAMVA